MCAMVTSLLLSSDVFGCRSRDLPDDFLDLISASSAPAPASLTERITIVKGYSKRLIPLCINLKKKSCFILLRCMRVTFECDREGKEQELIGSFRGSFRRPRENLADSPPTPSRLHRIVVGTIYETSLWCKLTGPQWTLTTADPILFRVSFGRGTQSRHALTGLDRP